MYHVVTLSGAESLPYRASPNCPKDRHSNPGPVDAAQRGSRAAPDLFWSPVQGSSPHPTWGFGQDSFSPEADQAAVAVESGNRRAARPPRRSYQLQTHISNSEIQVKSHGKVKNHPQSRKKYKNINCPRQLTSPTVWLNICDSPERRHILSFSLSHSELDIWPVKLSHLQIVYQKVRFLRNLLQTEVPLSHRLLIIKLEDFDPSNLFRHRSLSISLPHSV